MKREAERRAMEEELARALAQAQAQTQAQPQASQEQTTQTDSTSQSGESTSSKSSKANKESTQIKDSSSTPSASASDAISIVTSVGMKYIGNSVYVWGAQDPVNGYFDCSGFVNWAFKQAGYSIGRSTSSLSTEGTKVSVNDMRPGNLVFFDTYKKNGHVGIYLGNGKFIGSQSRGVGIADMTSGYYKDKFSGHVRRIIK